MLWLSKGITCQFNAFLIKRHNCSTETVLFWNHCQLLSRHWHHQLCLQGLANANRWFIERAISSLVANDQWKSWKCLLGDSCTRTHKYVLQFVSSDDGDIWTPRGRCDGHFWPGSSLPSPSSAGLVLVWYLPCIADELLFKCSRTHSHLPVSSSLASSPSVPSPTYWLSTSSNWQLATAWQLHHGGSSLRASCNHSLITANDHDDYS